MLAGDGTGGNDACVGDSDVSDGAVRCDGVGVKSPPRDD